MIFTTYQFTLQKEPPPVQWEPREELPKPLPPSNLVMSLVNRLKQQVTS